MSEKAVSISPTSDGRYSAPIKAEYLDKSRINSSYGYAGAKAKDPVDDRESTTPPAKKAKGRKARGQNKHRPDKFFPDPASRLCMLYILEGSCGYGDKCKYSHDIEGYMAKKPADLGDRCPSFEAHGKCPFGLACRFGSGHIRKEGEVYVNVIDESKPRPHPVKVLNTLSKELQRKLWKRTYDYGRADRFLKGLKNRKNPQQQKVKRSPENGTGTDPQAEISAVPSAKPEGKTAADVDLLPSTLGLDRIADNDGATPFENPSSQSSLTVMDVSQSESSGAASSSQPSPPAATQSPPNPSPSPPLPPTVGATTDGDLVPLRGPEKKQLDFSDKLYLAPLTTVGNLPFRRVCKELGADITCGEMAMCTNLLQGQQSEWALLKRHPSENIFGVQICGSYPDTMTKCAQVLSENIEADFFDINVGCPIDLVFNKGCGCALMGRVNKFEQVVAGMQSILDVPLTVKMRTGIQDKVSIAHKLIPQLRDWGVSLVTLHGRSRAQRYTKLANWDYIDQCAKVAAPMPLFGNGDILSYEDAEKQRQHTGVTGVMIARGALIKPWIFTEIKEQRHWDISSSERLDILKKFADYGLEHWGSDSQGVDRTRRFLLEWLSFLYRYIPVGLLERLPQKINQRPPFYFGRDDLETLMCSPSCSDWIKISELLLGPVPENFNFLPKHKANSY